MLHALAAGTAVVTTPLGADGVAAEGSTFLRIAESPAALAAAALRVLEAADSTARRVAAREFAREFAVEPMVNATEAWVQSARAAHATPAVSTASAVESPGTADAAATS